MNENNNNELSIDELKEENAKLAKNNEKILKRLDRVSQQGDRQHKQFEKLNEQLNIEVKDKTLTLYFPKEVGSHISGKIFLFKPSNINDDKEISFSSDNSIKTFDLSDFSTGMYKLKVNWNARENEYYNEEEIVIL